MTYGLKTRTTIPASPEWYVAVPIWSPTAPGGRLVLDGISLEPIIAWEIARDDEDILTEVTPILVDGIVNYADWAVKRPDGKFASPCEGGTYDDEAGLIERFTAARKPERFQQ